MALDAVLESLDGVPEALQEFYEEKDGKYRLSVTGVHFPDEVAGLKKNQQDLLAEKKRLAEKLAGIPEDFDPERWAQLTEAEKERERKKAEEKGEWEKLREQIETHHRKEKETWENEKKGLESELDLHLRKGEAVKEITGLDGSATLLLPHVLSKTKTIREDGKTKVIVVDDDGDRRLGPDGKDMTIAELVKEMSEDDEFAGAFAGTGSTGGGGASHRTGAGGADAVRTKADLKTTEAKVEYIEKHGVDAFNALPAT